MPAIPDAVGAAMRDNLEKYRNRYLKLNHLTLTHDQYLELVAPEAHHAILRDAAKYAEVYASERWIEVKPKVLIGGKEAEIALSFCARAVPGGKDAPLAPRDPTWQNKAHAAADVLKWMEWRVDVGQKAALVWHVIDQLSRWERGVQVRFVWPAVMHLCRPTNHFHQPKLEAWAQRNGKYKAQRYIPALSPGLREALKITSEWLTACALLPENMPDEPLHQEVEVNIGSAPFFFHGEYLYGR